MNLKKLTTLVLLAVLLCSSTSAFAQKPNIPSPDPDDQVAKISPMRKGDSAPFTGVLFSPRATATLIAELEAFNERIKIEVGKAMSDQIAKNQFNLNESESKFTTFKLIQQADIDTKTLRIKQLSKDLSDAQNAAANAPSRFLWAGLGAVVGVATTVLITFAVNQASK